MDKKLALRLYRSGYQAGHSDTVEGCFNDDPHGLDDEYYHGDAVNDILQDHQATGRCPQGFKTKNAPSGNPFLDA